MKNAAQAVPILLRCLLSKSKMADDPLLERAAPEFFTAEETAKYLQLHVKTVYRLVRKAKLPGSKVGGQWRFRREILEKWVGTEPTF